MHGATIRICYKCIHMRNVYLKILYKNAILIFDHEYRLFMDG